MANNNLIHWGIPNMKWGVRRYQNPDGTLTEEGKKRYYKAYKGLDDKYYKQQTTLNKDREAASIVRSQELEGEKQVLGGAQSALNSAANIMPTGNGKTVKKDYSNITDEELRKRVNRLQMEEQYGRLTGDTKYVKSGTEWTREVLQTLGSVAGIGVAAVTIYQALKKVGGKAADKALDVASN